jgi:hypothetical protein
MHGVMRINYLGFVVVAVSDPSPAAALSFILQVAIVYGLKNI